MPTLRRRLRQPARETSRDRKGIGARGEGGAGHHGERFLLFGVGGEQFAIAASFLCEVANPEGLQPIGEPAGPGGVTFQHRGVSIPALDLREVFGYPPAARAASARVLVGERGGGRLGLVVDRVGDVVDIAPQAILPLPEGASRLPATCFRGVLPGDHRLALVLDPGGLAAPEAPSPVGDVMASPRGGAV